MRNIHSGAPARQGGFAAILLVLLAGLGITAAVLGTSYFIRGTQEQHLATHTATQAQIRAWNGVEVVREYLVSADAATVAALPVGALSITGLTGVSATLISNVASANGSGRRIVINVTGSGASASTVIQTVYDTTPNTNAPVASQNGINIKKNLDLTGNITMIANSSAANLNVDGTVTLSGSISGINKLCATGDVTINSNITVTTVCTNGNLTLTGGSNVTDASVIGNVSLSGNTNVTSLLSNGNVSLSGGSASATTIATTGNVSITGGSAWASDITAEGNVAWSSSRGVQSISANGTVAYSGINNSTNISSTGNVTLSGTGDVNNITTKGNTTISSNWGKGVQGTLSGQGNFSWSSGITVNSGTVGGSISPALPAPAWAPSVNVTQTSGYTVAVPTVDVATISLVAVPVLTVDVYPLKSSANFVFEVDGSSRRKVTVKNVNGITDGTYFLGNYANDGTRGYKDFLCTALAADNTTCSAPTTPGKTICHGQSTSNNCVEYSAGKWTLKGESIAPGIAWFDGNLDLKSGGAYFNTFLATGDIATIGSIKVYSINYAGYTAICSNNRTAFGQTASSDFAGMYPTDYCNTTSQQMVSSTLGNAALIAGGYKDGVFVGGKIDLAASNDIFGNVIVGDVITTTGSSTVYGQVTVAAQGASSIKTEWKGSTTVDTSATRTGYDPSALPCMSTTCQSNAKAKVLWSRYL